MIIIRSNMAELGLAFAAGLGIGGFYFLALWLTVRRLPKARFPACLTLGSYLVRAAVSMAAFYLVMAGCWERMLASLLGFVVMRFLLVRRLQPQKPFQPAGGTC
jgi:F1F0 ATPase subunit 2